MPTTDERGIVSKSKLTALATAIKTKASVSGTYTLDDLVDVVADIGDDTPVTPSFPPFKIYDGFYTPTSSLSSIAITIPNETTVSHVLFGAIYIPDYNSYVDTDHVNKLVALQVSDAKYPVAGGWTSAQYNLCVKGTSSAYVGYNTQVSAPTYSGSKVTFPLRSCTTIPNVQMRVFFVYV